MSAYILIKLVHIAAIAVWSAALLYLPGLFARHPGVAGRPEAFRRLRYQTRLVYVGLMSPAAVIAVVSGTVLVFLAAQLGGWIVLKLFAVAAMVLLHVYLGRLMGKLYETPEWRRPAAHLVLLVPGVMVIALVIVLVSWKPI
ncbi:CopD family protein [Wenzhouxiangella sp. AB-CW3]|uniref:CopD family protein n=1 Tax=Wenzhouxiangella sp. AB-CW3 TaxID=2771012 RepID=UPI00168B02BF|nr:CopD family protein [Wenzhouxiangella sp. AB-CW3]QOC21697.1 CopD family protein [Wenzhouxiangella sp. AB-CW3]